MSPKCVQIGSEHSLPAAPWLSRGCHVSHKTCAAHRHVGTSISRPPRLAPHPKAPHPMTPARARRAHVWHHILGFQAFLLWVFAPPSYPALVRSWWCFVKLLLSYLRLSSSTSRVPVPKKAPFSAVRLLTCTVCHCSVCHGAQTRIGVPVVLCVCD